MRVPACRLGNRHGRSGDQPDLTQQDKWQPGIAQGFELSPACCKHPATPPFICLILKGTIKYEPGSSSPETEVGLKPLEELIPSLRSSLQGQVGKARRVRAGPASARTGVSCVDVPL